jgi:hypothetical protein
MIDEVVPESRGDGVPHVTPELPHVPVLTPTATIVSRIPEHPSHTQHEVSPTTAFSLNSCADIGFEFQHPPGGPRCCTIR